MFSRAPFAEDAWGAWKRSPLSTGFAPPAVKMLTHPEKEAETQRPPPAHLQTGIAFWMECGCHSPPPPPLSKP